jgi:hypothetical protein
MSNELMNLINASIEAGSINEARRTIIYDKAAQFNISKEECDIYIENALRNNKSVNEAVSAGRKYQGAVLLVFGLIDLAFGIDCATKGRHYEETALVCILTGLAMVFFGMFLLKLLNSKKMTTIGYWIGSIPFYSISFVGIVKGGFWTLVFFPLGIAAFVSYIVLLRKKMVSSSALERMEAKPFVQKIDAFWSKYIKTKS